MSHELRTPLNSIIGFSELLKQKIFGDLNEKQEHYVDNINKSGKHLLDLITSVLDICCLEEGRVEVFVEKLRVQDIIKDAILLTKEKAQKHNITFKIDIDPQLDIIEGDRRSIKQILCNLLSNAVKFSKPEGGVVTVTAKKEGDMARFSVSDTGIGIKKEDMDKLFRTFEQIDSGICRKYGGAGLGLAIVKQLVEIHGGTITVESKYGEGSTFTFLLPLKSRIKSC
jgi:signal transduction histidine kinase